MLHVISRILLLNSIIEIILIILDAILRMIIENGKGIEVNTAGLKYGMSDPNPHHEIIKRYMELGGEIITIGSDGHCPKHMAYEFL